VGIAAHAGAQGIALALLALSRSRAGRPGLRSGSSARLRPAVRRAAYATKLGFDRRRMENFVQYGSPANVICSSLHVSYVPCWLSGRPPPRSNA